MARRWVHSPAAYLRRQLRLQPWQRPQPASSLRGRAAKTRSRRRRSRKHLSWRMPSGPLFPAALRTTTCQPALPSVSQRRWKRMPVPQVAGPCLQQMQSNIRGTATRSCSGTKNSSSRCRRLMRLTARQRLKRSFAAVQQAPADRKESSPRGGRLYPTARTATVGTTTPGWQLPQMVRCQMGRVELMTLRPAQLQAAPRLLSQHRQILQRGKQRRLMSSNVLRPPAAPRRILQGMLRRRRAAPVSSPPCSKLPTARQPISQQRLRRKTCMTAPRTASHSQRSRPTAHGCWSQ